MSGAPLARYVPRAQMPRALSIAFTALTACLAVLASTACTHLAAVDSNALWKIVGGQCVPAAQASRPPGPCTKVDLQAHYALLKDINGAAQYLLIPTDRVAGIESPEILYAGSPEYWADAWTSRHYVETRVKRTLAADQIGLEINSAHRRSQNQLHIHIDCLRPDVTSALAPHRTDSPNTWREMTLDGNRYRVMRVTSLKDASNPFRIVARSLPDGQAMDTQTILVTGAGADAGDGWIVVNSSLDGDDGTGTAEGLLDHACRVGTAG